jgi:RHS repeat-associated protein
VAAVTPSPSITRRFNHADALGSVVAVSVAAGAVSERFAYTVYGVADANTGSAMRYTGRRLDATTGLYDLRARDYSPMLGRFLQADPIGIAGRTNLYAYVGNDPLEHLST